MNKEIKLLIEGLFDDDIFNKDEYDNSVDVAQSQFNDEKILSALKTLQKKSLKGLSLNKINNLSDECFKIDNFFGKRQDVKNKNFCKFIHNLISTFNYSSEILNLNFIDTSNITSFTSLFYGISSNQIKIDISRWNTKNVEDLDYCFYNSDIPGYCDISNWDVSSVQSMTATFSYSWIKFDLSKWKFTQLMSLNSTFKHVHKINFDFSKWDTSKVEIMYQLFSTIQFNNKDVQIKPEYIENLNVSSCEDFREMFCLYFGESLNLNNWTFTDKVINMKDMFKNISKKINIDVSDWVNKLPLDILFSDSYIKKQITTPLFNKITQNNISINTFRYIVSQKVFRDMLKNYTIKLEKIEES